MATVGPTALAAAALCTALGLCALAAFTCCTRRKKAKGKAAGGGGQRPSASAGGQTSSSKRKSASWTCMGGGEAEESESELPKPRRGAEPKDERQRQQMRLIKKGVTGNKDDYATLDDVSSFSDEINDDDPYKLESSTLNAKDKAKKGKRAVASKKRSSGGGGAAGRPDDATQKCSAERQTGTAAAGATGARRSEKPQPSDKLVATTPQEHRACKRDRLSAAAAEAKGSKEKAPAAGRELKTPL